MEFRILLGLIVMGFNLLDVGGGGFTRHWSPALELVWNLLLQAGSEGPTLISQTVAHLLSLSAVCCARGTP